MNRLLEPETTEQKQRGRMPRFLRDEDTQSMIVGIILTLILWPLVVAGFSWAIAHLHGKSDIKFGATQARRQFNIELAPQEPRVKPPPPNRFVETNPDAPENIPDKTRNFAAQNQQAAQEKPAAENKSDHAATEGRKDIDSTQVVSGHLNPEKQVPTAPAPTPANAPAKAVQRREQNPLSGFDKDAGETKNAFGTNVAQVAENEQPVPQKVEGAKDVPLIEGANSTVPQIDPMHPRPRQTLSDHNVRPAIFAENPAGTSRIGLNAWDARWSNYGEYLQRLIDTIQTEWDRILTNSGALPPSGTHVVVKFTLTSEGKVKFVSVDPGNSDAGDLGAHYCTAAISSRAPYDKWTDDMVAMLGDQQELTFAFYYQ